MILCVEEVNDGSVLRRRGGSLISNRRCLGGSGSDSDSGSFGLGLGVRFLFFYFLQGLFPVALFAIQLDARDVQALGFEVAQVPSAIFF